MMQLIGSAIFVLVCVTPVLADEMTNLIPNSSFEIDDDGDGMPDGWRFDWKYTHNDDREQGREKQKPRAGWDNKVVHSGGRSLYVANERPEDDGVWTMSDMPVGQGVRYVKLQAWMKTENLHATDAKVAGVFLGRRANGLVQTTAPLQ